LVNACTKSSGDSATMAASQIRRLDSRAVVHVITSAHSDSSNAVTM
jgi:hypothetical protein